MMGILPASFRAKLMYWNQRLIIVPLAVSTSRTILSITQTYES